MRRGNVCMAMIRTTDSCLHDHNSNSIRARNARTRVSESRPLDANGIVAVAAEMLHRNTQT